MSKNDGRCPNLTLVLVLLGILASPGAALGQKLKAAQAKDHVGASATVCGMVVAANYAARTKGEPTYLYLDKAYPNHIFMVVIWGEARPRFGKPEVTYGGKKICVSGRIQSSRNVPQIVVSEPSQIKLDNPGK